MLEHLFHLARSSGSFTYYSAVHRLPALYYVHFDFLAVIAAAVSLATILLVLLPVLRNRRSTFVLGMMTIATGAVIGYCIMIPDWQTGRLELSNMFMSYWPGSPRQDCNLNLRIGLSGVNVTLSCDFSTEFYYNEHLGFEEQIGQLRRSLMPALLSVLVPLSENCFHMRRAGYWTEVILYFSLALWIYSSLLLVTVPQRVGGALWINGCMLLVASAVYHFLQSGHTIPAPHGMKVCYGPCLWTCAAFGALLSITGVYFRTTCSYNEEQCITTFYMEMEENRNNEHGNDVPEPETESELTPSSLAALHTVA